MTDSLTKEEERLIRDKSQPTCSFSPGRSDLKVLLAELDALRAEVQELEQQSHGDGGGDQ